jgi:protein-S-isoprenylcysteine O-methyltransferase Ste14
VLLGWAALFQSTAMLFYAICVGVVFHLFMVLYEEAHLMGQFGVEYENYCANVGRWLPHFHQHHAA